jgi:Protein of unknown function (DUF3027)
MPSNGEPIHRRWFAAVNRTNDENDPQYDESWAWEQCGACRFWMPLAGTLGLDWGACSNGASRFDGWVRFEHDGCEHFEKDPEGWRTPQRAPIPTEGETE